ncbi:MAG TPA: hypothetical protein VKO18_07630 [Terriglobia bacterium]|nr:hypothetical protein [Terriglobia bacterium]
MSKNKGALYARWQYATALSITSLRSVFTLQFRYTAACPMFSKRGRMVSTFSGFNFHGHLATIRASVLRLAVATVRLAPVVLPADRMLTHGFEAS